MQLKKQTAAGALYAVLGLHQPAWAVARECAGSPGGSGRVDSALLGGTLQGGLGAVPGGVLQTQQRMCHSRPGSWGSLPVPPSLMPWLSGSCFPGAIPLLPGRSS